MLGFSELMRIFKRSFEFLLPTLRVHYPVLKKALVTNVKTLSGNNYSCDIQILLNNEKEDKKYNIIGEVPISIGLGGLHGGGIYSVPVVGAICNIMFYDGDINSPVIVGFIRNKPAPIDLSEGEVSIQKGLTDFLKFKSAGGSTLVSSSNILLQSLGKTTIQAGEVETIAKDTYTVKGSGNLNFSFLSGAKILAKDGIAITDGANRIEIGAVKTVSNDGATTIGTGMKLSTQGLAEIIASKIALIGDRGLDIMVTNILNITSTSIMINVNESLGDAIVLKNTGLGNIVINNVGVGKIIINNSIGGLGSSLEEIYILINDIADLVNDILTAIPSIIVGTGVGPSSPPNNSADFLNIQVSLTQKITELKTLKLKATNIFKK